MDPAHARCRGGLHQRRRARAGAAARPVASRLRGVRAVARRRRLPRLPRPAPPRLLRTDDAVGAWSCRYAGRERADGRAAGERDDRQRKSSRADAMPWDAGGPTSAPHGLEGRGGETPPSRGGASRRSGVPRWPVVARARGASRRERVI